MSIISKRQGQNDDSWSKNQRLLSSTRNLLKNLDGLILSGPKCSGSLTRVPYTSRKKIMKPHFITSLDQPWAKKEIRALLFYTGISSVADPWHFGTDPDPRIHASDKNTIIFLLKVFFAYYFLKVQYIYIIFKDKKSKRRHKTVGIKVFLLFMLDDRRIRIRTSLTNGSGSRKPQKQTDATDPDPHYWVQGWRKSVWTTAGCYLAAEGLGAGRLCAGDVRAQSLVNTLQVRGHADGPQLQPAQLAPHLLQPVHGGHMVLQLPTR